MTRWQITILADAQDSDAIDKLCDDLIQVLRVHDPKPESWDMAVQVAK